MWNRELFIAFIMLGFAFNFASLMYYFGHWILFTNRVFKKGECLEVTLVEKKIITNRGIKEIHGQPYSASDAIYMLFCKCTYVVKVGEGRTTKKDVRVESVEPLYCYFKTLHRDYKIHKLEIEPEPRAKFKYRKIMISTKHDYYVMLVNLLGIAFVIMIGLFQVISR